MVIIVIITVKFRRAALEKWKQYNGSKATYRSLIVALEQAGHKDYAETVRKIAGEYTFYNL